MRYAPRAALCILLAAAAAFADERPGIAELRREAAAGKPQAQFDLATHLAYGLEPPDYAAAAHWLRQAAEQGHADAQNSLGLAYHAGRGVERDEAQAYKWWKLAAENGIAGAQYWLGDAYERGLGGLAVDHAAAAKWYRKSAEQGDAHGQGSLGDLYAKGRGVPRDDAQAVAWYRKAAEQGIATGQHSLGEMYWEGRGVKRDDAHAVSWFRKAAEQNFTVAQTSLARAYESGRGTGKDLVCAYFWYGLAERNGFEVWAEDADALEPVLGAAQLAEAQRRIAATKYESGVLQRPMCAGESLTLSIENAPLGSLLRAFETLCACRFEGPHDPETPVRIKVDAVPWEQALEQTLAAAGLAATRDGEVYRLRPVTP